MSDFINSTVNTKFYNLMSDEHQIITITDKEAVVENIGTIASGDTNSCLLTFEINRFQDGIDLSDKKVRFNYKNSNGKFYDIAVNVKYNDDVIRFSWLLPYSLTYPGGNVIASIEFYGYIEYDEEYSYKTKNFKLSVEKSLGVDDDRSDESYNNWAIKIDNSIESIQNKISEIEKDIKDIYVPMDSELSDSSSNPVENRVIKNEMDKKITSPSTAEVGQTIIVKSVDSNGKPTEWEAMDLPKKMVVNFSGDGTKESPYTFDKTFSELYDAYYDGYEISAIFSGTCGNNRYYKLQLSLLDEPLGVFKFISVINEKEVIIAYLVDIENLSIIYANLYPDDSLSIYGRPADALAVGTRLSEIEKPTDWNQNDETQIDYIKNRPFYDTVTQEDIITEQTKSFTYSSSNNWYMTSIYDKKTLTDGVNCKILWDGTVYDVVSKTESYSCFGDKNFIEYPFYFILSVSEASGEIYGYNIYTNDTSSSHTFRIYTEKTDVKCIDEKYLPFTSETFTFTLEDGTEIVKEVYVKP